MIFVYLQALLANRFESRSGQHKSTKLVKDGDGGGGPSKHPPMFAVIASFSIGLLSNQVKRDYSHYTIHLFQPLKTSR